MRVLGRTKPLKNVTSLPCFWKTGSEKASDWSDPLLCLRGQSNNATKTVFSYRDYWLAQHYLTFLICWKVLPTLGLSCMRSQGTRVSSLSLSAIVTIFISWQLKLWLYSSARPEHWQQNNKCSSSHQMLDITRTDSLATTEIIVKFLHVPSIQLRGEIEIKSSRNCLP